MEHERCYIYTPSDSEEPTPKRQRISKEKQASPVQERLGLFRQLWSRQEQCIQTTLEEADSATLEEIASFIAASPADAYHAIPTGLVVAGPSIASHGSFFGRLGRRITENTDSTYHVMTSSESPNLKTFLKNLIKKITSRIADDDDEDDLGAYIRSSRRGPKVLDFDLQHVHEWQKKNNAGSIVVAIQDSEAFDSGLLVEIIDLFYCWRDRLPFVLLFGIATSAESFEDRLSGMSHRYLDGKKFDVTQSDVIVEKLFRATVASTDVPFRIGPAVARRILDRQKDHVQNTQDFSDGLKYAHMSHFYASYPSILLREGNGNVFQKLPSELFEAVRNLPSFRRLTESLLNNGETSPVRKLLDSNQSLFDAIHDHLERGQNALNALSGATVVLSHIRELFQMSPSTRFSSIWIRAASADLLGSPLFRETMLSVRKAPSDRVSSLLESLLEYQQYLPLQIASYQQELQELIKSSSDSAPLRSQHDVRNDSLRTTVVAQKVLLSKHKAALSEQDKAYSDLIGRFHDELETYFTSTLIDPQNLFLVEVLMYDFKSPHTEVFQPRPRFAIERALSSPHDYLSCDCCGTGGERDGVSALEATQPATALLYQLYLESGQLVNVSDLWSAFHAIAGDEDEESQANTMALFQRGLAELKYLGFVKPTRKKTDHITKIMWKGL